ncbi:hypothetical protein FRX31_011368, partial [Thalictrum thalictroides]
MLMRNIIIREPGIFKFSSWGPRAKRYVMRKYSGYLSSLKKNFLKKRKKGKLPKDARTTLLD